MLMTTTSWDGCEPPKCSSAQESEELSGGNGMPKEKLTEIDSLQISSSGTQDIPLTDWRCVLPLHHKCQSVGGYRMYLDRSFTTRVWFLSSSFTLPRSTPPKNKSTQHRSVLHPCRSSLNHIPPYLLEWCWCHCCWSVSRASGCSMSHISDSIIAKSTKWLKGRKRRFVKAFSISCSLCSFPYPVLPATP